MRCSSAIQARQLVFGAITQPPPHSDDPLVERVIRASVNGAAGIVLGNHTPAALSPGYGTTKTQIAHRR